MTSDQEIKNDLSRITANLYESRIWLKEIVEKRTAEHELWRRKKLNAIINALHKTIDDLTTLKNDWEVPQ